VQQALTFSVSIAGMRAGIYYDTVRVTSNNATTATGTSAAATPAASTTVSSASSSDVVPVILKITDPPGPGAPNGGRLAVYDVEFSMTGYVGLLNGAPECKVRPNGFDRMVGTLIGLETGEQDDDMVYYGILRRETDIDYCETKGRKRPGDDERVWCELTLKGWSVENVELTVHSDSARGGWLKSKSEPGYSSAGISKNSCDPQETQDAANGYANSDDGGGGSPGGQQIDDV
jgi:hypothetical protein